MDFFQFIKALIQNFLWAKSSTMKKNLIFNFRTQIPPVLSRCSRLIRLYSITNSVFYIVSILFCKIID